MQTVVGISLRTAGKLYYFDPGTERYIMGEKVLVETTRGAEIGTVKLPSHEVAENEIVQPLKPIIRRASTADISKNSLNREREEHALKVCKRLVEKLNLPMRLIDAQYTFDGSHLLIHFLAENRIDFRELVRELAHELHTRIELRQVGVRDEAKLIGGYGICGRHLCCSAFLDDFTPVSISMAKDQGLALNPQKISGTCGRLMCCLAYECAHYRHEKADLPRVNARVETPQGEGKVTKLNVLSHQVEVFIPEVSSSPIWFPVEEIVFTRTNQAKPDGKQGCGKCCGKSTKDSPEASESLIGSDEASNNATTPAESGRSRARRRRKKKPAAAGDAMQPALVATDAQTAQKTKRSRRRHKTNASQAQAGATATPVTVPPDGAQKIPSGRYRPRRRRGPRPEGAAPTQS